MLEGGSVTVCQCLSNATTSNWESRMLSVRLCSLSGVPLLDPVAVLQYLKNSHVCLGMDCVKNRY